MLLPQQSTVSDAAARAPSMPITGASSGVGELCSAGHR